MGDNGTQTYPDTASDWLARWDAGEEVLSVEMGGFGPDYEQPIQESAAEILRIMLNFPGGYVPSESSFSEVEEQFHALQSRPHGITGAQFGAAANIASCFFVRGCRDALSDPSLADRIIMVRKTPGTI